MMDDRGELERVRVSDEGVPQQHEHHQPHRRHEEVEEASFVVLESGRICFFVRPRVQMRTATSFSDVQKFMFTLAPRNGSLVRRVSVGKKRMPDDRARERQWAYVDRVGSGAAIVADLGPKTYTTKTRGVRHQAGAIEVARGTYAVASHRDHVHLLYALEIEAKTASAPLLEQLRIVTRASYIAAVFNPESKWRVREAAEEVPFREPSIYDDALMERFGDRRFAPLEPAFLDHEGAELVLIGGGQQRSTTTRSSKVGSPTARISTCIPTPTAAARLT